MLFAKYSGTSKFVGGGEIPEPACQECGLKIIRQYTIRDTVGCVEPDLMPQFNAIDSSVTRLLTLGKSSGSQALPARQSQPSHDPHLIACHAIRSNNIYLRREQTPPKIGKGHFGLHSPSIAPIQAMINSFSDPMSKNCLGYQTTVPIATIHSVPNRKTVN